METLESIVGYLRAIENGLRDEGRSLIAATLGTLKPCDAVVAESKHIAAMDHRRSGAKNSVAPADEAIWYSYRNPYQVRTPSHQPF